MSSRILSRRRDRRSINKSSRRRSRRRRTRGVGHRSVSKYISDTQQKIRKNPVAANAVGTALGLATLSAAAYALFSKTIEKKINRKQKMIADLIEKERVMFFNQANELVEKQTAAVFKQTDDLLQKQRTALLNEAEAKIEKQRTALLTEAGDKIEKERTVALNQAEEKFNNCTKNLFPRMIFGVRAVATHPTDPNKELAKSWLAKFGDLFGSKPTATPLETGMSGGSDDATCDLRPLEPFLKLDSYFHQLYSQDHGSFLVLYNQFLDDVLLNFKHSSRPLHSDEML